MNVTAVILTFNEEVAKILMIIKNNTVTVIIIEYDSGTGVSWDIIIATSHC